MKYEELYNRCVLYVEKTNNDKSYKSCITYIKSIKAKLNQKALQKAIPEIRELYYQLDEIERPYNELLKNIDKEIEICDRLIQTYSKLVKHYSSFQTQLKSTTNLELKLGGLSGGFDKSKTKSEINSDFDPEKARELKRIIDEIKTHQNKLNELNSSSKEYKKKFKHLNAAIIRAAKKNKSFDSDMVSQLVNTISEFDSEISNAIFIPPRLKKLDIYTVESTTDHISIVYENLYNYILESYDSGDIDCEEFEILKSLL